MSSLRRLLSVDRTDCAILSEQFGRSCLARHRSLPILSLHDPKGLPSLPRTPTFRSPEARHCHGLSHADKRDSISRQFSSFPSAPAWSAEDGLGSGACTIPQPTSGKEGLDTGDSVVYKELLESIGGLEVPSRHMRMVNSEGTLGSTATQVNGELPQDGSSSKVEPCSIDVKGRPLSLRMLKRRGSRSSSSSVISDARQDLRRRRSHSEVVKAGTSLDAGDSVNSAFSSLLFMMESLQQQTLRLRRFLISEADTHLQVLMMTVHQEMQETFLRIFQQVFSYTPKLMLLTMLLLSDFAVHSMGQHVALGVMPMGEPPTGMERASSLSTSPFAYLNERGSVLGSHGTKTLFVPLGMVEPRLCEGGAGNKGVRCVKVGGGMDGKSIPMNSTDQAAMTSKDGVYSELSDASLCRCFTSSGGGGVFPKTGDTFCSSDDVDEGRKLSAIWEQVVTMEPSPRPLTQTRHMLVAPIQAPVLEADDYPCYDRTDLEYQHELIRDPSNPLLLANYAQFLHVVRHDHNRAEAMYKRAVQADPVDGEVMGKFASFLWVAKEDTKAADEAYKAAIAVDPTNAYHAGSYAHFLWNSGSGSEDAASTCANSYQQVSLSHL